MSSWKHHEPHPITGTCVWCHANSTSSVGCTRGESTEEKAARLESELASARAENEAWRALAKWCALRPQRRINHQELFGQVSVSAQDGIGNERTSDWAQQPGVAAIDLATKLGLPPTGAEEST